MGYTHYWRRPAKFDPDTFALFVADVTLICEHPAVKDVICHIDYENDDAVLPPCIEPVYIEINGLPPDDCQPFCVAVTTSDDVARRLKYISGEDRASGLFRHHCMTGRRPYDTAVTACLARLKHHFPEVQMSSDGDPADWVPGLNLCIDLFGEDSVLPFEMSDA
jgi:hypothetical protein